MASHGIVDQVLAVESFTAGGGSDIVRTTLNLWLVDALGARNTRTSIQIDIVDTDNLAAINSKIQTAANAKATALGYNLIAGANLLITFTRV